MNHLPRLCAYCHAPLAGRADQRYCSSSCKSKDFRRLQAVPFVPDEDDADEPEEDAPRFAANRPAVKVALCDPFPQPPRRVAGAPAAPDEEAEPDEWRVTGQELEYAVGQALERQAQRQLPAQYAACVERVLAAHGQQLASKPLRALRERLAQAIRAYACQAARGELPPTLVAQLTALHRLQQLLDEAWEEFAAQRRPVTVHVKKKWRSELRASLSLLGPT